MTVRTVIIDCAQAENKARLHDLLAKELALPEWYGRNLDALYDCLTDICEETHLILKNHRSLGTYGAALARTLEDADRSPYLTVEIQ